MAQLKTLLQQLIVQQRDPIDAYRCLEKPSHEVTEIMPPVSREQIEKQKSASSKLLALFKQEEDQEPAVVKFPNLTQEMQMVEWAGLGLGRSELHLLYLAIKKLAEKLPEEVGALRFWGRVSTRGLPYYIVEGGSVEEEEPEDLKAMEGKEGVNRYTYWVSQSLEPDSWTQLPAVTCLQIVVSMKFDRFFTGNLEAAVPSYPPFPGTEKSLLRAQIARITGATLISPEGYFKYEDDEAEVKEIVPSEAEELKERFPKAAHLLLAASAWRHHEKQLNRLGRCSALPEELDEEGEVLVTEDSLTPVSVAYAKVEAENWSFRLSPTCGGASPSAAVIARSLLWPGAVVVAAPKKFLCAYFGNGRSAASRRVAPLLPAAIGREADMSAFMEQEDTLVDPTPPPPPEPEEEEEGEDAEEEDE